MDNNSLISILLDNWKYTFTTYKEFQLLIVFSSSNSFISKIFRNYIRVYLSNYNSVEKKMIDVFFINTLYKYRSPQDALILKKIVQHHQINNIIYKLCRRRLDSNIYKWYLASLSKINSYNLLKSVFDYSSKYANLEVLSSLRLLSLTNKTHNTIIIDMVNSYVENIIDNRLEYITNIDEDIIIYNPHIYHLFMYYIFRGSKNKALRIYKLYTNKNISRPIRKLCQYSLQYKYGMYLTKHHGIIFS